MKVGIIKRTKKLHDIILRPGNELNRDNISVNISIQCLKKIQTNKNGKDILHKEILKDQIIETYHPLFKLNKDMAKLPPDLIIFVQKQSPGGVL